MPAWLKLRLSHFGGGDSTGMAGGDGPASGGAAAAAPAAGGVGLAAGSSAFGSDGPCAGGAAESLHARESPRGDIREIAGNLDARMHHMARQIRMLAQESDHQERVQRLQSIFEQLLLEREQLHHELMNEQGESSDTRRPLAPSRGNRGGQAIPPASRLCRHAGHFSVCVVSKARESWPAA